MLVGDLLLQVAHLRQAAIADPQAILQARQRQDCLLYTSVVAVVVTWLQTQLQRVAGLVRRIA